MYSLEEAKTFVTEMAENIWQNGLVERIPEVYTKDLVGHFQGKTFGYDDVVERMQSLNQNGLRRQFSVQDVEVINDLIIFRMRQVWLSVVSDCLCESLVTAIYRIHSDKKICELWLMADQEMDEYTQASKNVAENIDRFQVVKREKAAFLQQMTDYMNFEKTDPKKLSSVEIECLFYYLNGYTAKEVAKAMDISHRTVEGYISNIKQKYHCSTRRDLRQVLFPGHTAD